MGNRIPCASLQIDVVEMFDQVIPAADKDVVKVFTKRISKQFNLMLETKVTAVEAKEDGIYVTMVKRRQNHNVNDAVLAGDFGRVPSKPANCWMPAKPVLN